MKARLNSGNDPNLYFFRDRHGHEVDLLYQQGSTLIPIEVKAAQRDSSDFLKNLRFFEELAGEKAGPSYLVYAGSQEQKIGTTSLLNYAHSARICHPL